jgi:hypothetical protein
MLAGEEDWSMASDKANEGEERKPYVKPVLECTTVYEASGATCCKATNQTCSVGGRSGLGKDQKLQTLS